MKKSMMFGVVLSIIFISFSSCGNVNNFHFDEKTFMANWNAWNNQNIQNYSFTLTESYSNWNNARGTPDWNTYKFNIVVKNGLMDSFEYSVFDHEDRPVDGIYNPPFTSISDMYKEIYNRAKFSEKMWKKNEYKGYYLSTEYIIDYNSELHYITFFGIYDEWNPNFCGSPASPFKVSDFKVLD